MGNVTQQITLRWMGSVPTLPWQAVHSETDQLLAVCFLCSTPSAARTASFQWKLCRSLSCKPQPTPPKPDAREAVNWQSFRDPVPMNFTDQCSIISATKHSMPT